MASFYIDPDSPTNGVGSEADPFNVWPTILSNNNYYQKRGTSINLTANLTIANRSNVYIGAYGAGADPIITGYTTSTSTGDWSEAAANIWLLDTGELVFRTPVLLGLGSLGDKDNPSWTARVNYLGGGTGTSGAGAFTTFGDWDQEDGSGVSTAKLYVYADANPVTKWGTVYYTKRNFGQIIYPVQCDTVTVENIHMMHGHMAINAVASSGAINKLTVKRITAEHMFRGIYISGSTNGVGNLLVDNNNVYACANTGIEVTSHNLLTNNRMTNNKVYDTGVNESEGIGAFYIRPTGGDLTVYKNEVYNVHKGRYWSGEAHGLYSERGCTNVTWMKNRVDGCDQSGCHINGGSSGVSYRGNLVTNCLSGMTSSDSNAEQSDDFEVIYNRFINNPTGMEFVRPTSLGTMTAVLKANIFVSDGSTGSTGIKTDSDVDTLGGVDEDYNHVYNFDTARDGGGGTLGSNSSTDDPQLDSNNRLLNTSPCIGAAPKLWTGANPETWDGDPISDFDSDIGFGTTFGPFHTKNL